MMNYEMVMQVLNRLGENAIVDDDDEREIEVEINDFKGFDKNWKEILNEYDEELVDEVWDILKAECSEYRCECGVYEYFVFDEFQIVWGYSSFNI